MHTSTDGNARVTSLSARLNQLDESLTKSSLAAKLIREAIQEGVFRPGDHLKLTMLAEELNMSYTPLREALQQLHSEGLIETRPHSSAIVLGLDMKRAREIYELRMVLEPHASQLACRNATFEEISRLININEEMINAATNGRLELIPGLNQKFHMTLYELSASPILLDFIRKLWNGVPYQALSLSDRSGDSVEGHAKVLEALRTGNSDAAARAMHSHIEAGAEAALAYLAELNSRNA